MKLTFPQQLIYLNQQPLKSYQPTETQHCWCKDAVLTHFK